MLPIENHKNMHFTKQKLVLILCFLLSKNKTYRLTKTPVKAQLSPLRGSYACSFSKLHTCLCFVFVCANLSVIPSRISNNSWFIRRLMDLSGIWKCSWTTGKNVLCMGVGYFVWMTNILLLQDTIKHTFVNANYIIHTFFNQYSVKKK